MKDLRFFVENSRRISWIDGERLATLSFESGLYGSGFQGSLVAFEIGSTGSSVNDARKARKTIALVDRIRRYGLRKVSYVECRNRMGSSLLRCRDSGIVR